MLVADHCQEPLLFFCAQNEARHANSIEGSGTFLDVADVCMIANLTKMVARLFEVLFAVFEAS